MPFLWAHQNEILEAYNDKHLNTQDLALELPTGTGKTLIGLLIAEFRRRRLEDRALYLAPTRQLAHQVGGLARQYGIPAEVCLAPAYEGMNRWMLGGRIAVTVYSSLFNVNPVFGIPNTIILDDAHAAEDYLADHWTVTVPRDSDAFQPLLEFVRPAIDEYRLADLLDDGARFTVRYDVDLVPTPSWWPHVDAIRELLDHHLARTDERFSWSVIRNHLQGCFLLLSWGHIAFRPLVPPTQTLDEFREADQRLYMSATLGAGGELERISGVRQIDRLPAPPSWENQASGRRLFLFPDASIKPKERDELIIQAVKAADRGLVLAPTRIHAGRRRDQFEAERLTVLGPRDIEESLVPFVEADEAALVLANRYDGLDLPEDACRLLIIDGVPAGTNLLEHFLQSRLALISLIRERMRTRFVQGVGRCCRRPTDFAAVIVSGPELLDFCAHRRNLRTLHPELQAEVELGLEESSDTDAENFMVLLELMLNQGEEWREFDEDIRERRESVRRERDPNEEVLAATVAAEVDFVYELWRGHFPGALERALAVMGELSGGQLERYRAWWNYLGGTAAWLQAQAGDTAAGARAVELFGAAARASKTISWFAELASSQRLEVALEWDADALRAAERAREELARLGYNGPGLTRRLEEAREVLDAPEAGKFEQGLEKLGLLLGLDARRPGERGAPDGVWLVSDQLAFVLEAKSEEHEAGAIGTRTVQQAEGHLRWLHEEGLVHDDANVHAVLDSSRLEISEDALPHVEDLTVVSVEEMRKLLPAVGGALERARAVGADSDPEATRGALLRELHAIQALPQQLFARLTRHRVDELKVRPG